MFLLFWLVFVYSSKDVKENSKEPCCKDFILLGGLTSSNEVISLSLFSTRFMAKFLFTLTPKSSTVSSLCPIVVLSFVYLVSLCVHESSTSLTFCLISQRVSLIAWVLPINLLSRYEIDSNKVDKVTDFCYKNLLRLILSWWSFDELSVISWDWRIVTFT